MIELTTDCFNDICNDPAVRAQLSALEENRAAAVRRFWIWTVAAILLAGAAYISLGATGWQRFSFIAAILFLVLGIGLGWSALSKVGEALKVPVLQALATKAGMQYLESGFSPPAYPEAQKALFGSWLNRQAFTDLFHGKDEEGRNFAVYEALLQRSSGKSEQTVFRGQIYAIERRPSSSATTVIVPDRGLFNFMKPMSGLERVESASDPEFEKRFETYSTSEAEARQLLFDSDLRQRLLNMRQAGRVFVYVGPTDALVAATGSNRFEPGSMLRSRPGDDRVRSMVSDVCEALATLRALKAKLG
ncbi:MAG TPA: DUF3137 domain-containing protein [Allosphingosinicella sp.]|jgi:hypothetical protein|nr:DUF3137 domain-containing protein [Allosphingosinicella sp.]